jgi:hypothetical protein
MPIDPRQRILAAVFAIGLLITILELVRRRKLKEHYSVLWIAAGIVILVVGLNYNLLFSITRFIGAGYTSSTLFFFGLFFVIALCLQFSVTLSGLETRQKNLAQRIAMLEAKRGDSPNAQSDKREMK